MKNLITLLMLIVFANLIQAQNIKKIVEKYFKTYEGRDFEALQKLYDKEAVFEDIIFGEYRKGIEDIFKFLNQGVELHLVNNKDKSFGIFRI